MIGRQEGVKGCRDLPIAYAGWLRASSAVCSRHCSTTYIPVGVPSRHMQDILSINDDEGVNNRGGSERYLATPPPSFQRKLACMDAGGRAASGTGRRGIQWFIQSIPAKRECHYGWFGTGRQGRILFRSSASPSWIPAFAGMTSGAGMKEMEEYLKGVARNKKPRHSGLRRNDDERVNNKGGV